MDRVEKAIITAMLTTFIIGSGVLCWLNYAQTPQKADYLLRDVVQNMERREVSGIINPSTGLFAAPAVMRREQAKSNLSEPELWYQFKAMVDKGKFDFIHVCYSKWTHWEASAYQGDPVLISLSVYSEISREAAMRELYVKITGGKKWTE